MEFFWEIVEHDGTITKIPPDKVEVVQRRWDNKEPIHATTRSIPASQIKKFRITGEPYSSQPLLEEAARAFNEPIETEDGIQVKWVKKFVPQQSKLLATPSYRSLGQENGMTVVAFRLPVHLIDLNKVTVCTDDEVNSLTNR